MRRKKKYSKHDLLRIGARPNVVQIVPPRGVMRPRIVHDDETEQDHELLSQPLASPTGPGGAAGFQNVAGSQIPVPQVTNIYLGQFWGDQNLVEAFSKAIVENGYLDPLQQLGLRNGPRNIQRIYQRTSASIQVQPSRTATRRIRCARSSTRDRLAETSTACLCSFCPTE